MSVSVASVRFEALLQHVEPVYVVVSRARRAWCQHSGPFYDVFTQSTLRFGCVDWNNLPLDVKYTGYERGIRMLSRS